MIPGSSSAQFFGAAGASGGGIYEISRSLRFNSSDSAYLSRTPASAGNRRTYTLSFWTKRAALSSSGYQAIFSAGTGSGANSGLYFSSDKLEYFHDAGSSGLVFSAAVLRDVSAWYHIIVSVDTTQSTAANRVKIYINGVDQVLTGTQPTQNLDSLYINQTNAHNIGRRTNGDFYVDAYFSDFFFIDGQALDPTSFGEFDDNGIWQPKAYTGTYGTNGFHLPFSDNSTAAALGTDTSGNGNTWTVNNITVVAPSYSSPTNANTPVYDITIGPTNPLSGVGVWSDAFNGDSNNYGVIGPITFINTKPTWSTSTGVELMASGNGITASVNGATQVALANNAFVTISSGSSGTLNSIWIYNSTGSSSIKRVRVDGVDISVRALLGKASDIDSLVDVPTNGTETDTGVGGEVRGNYCTWNPLDTAGTTLSNGNLDARSTAAGISKGTIAVNSGKWYWEITTNAGSNSIGIALANLPPSTPYLGSGGSWSYYAENGQIYTNGSGTNYGASYGVGDVIGVALDLDAGTLVFYKNGVSQGTAATGLTSTYVAGAGNDQNGPSVSANFGQRPFAYSAPSGFKALNTANLPAPVVTKPSEVMDVALYTGNGSTQTISGLGFSPDLVWFKDRTTYSHQLYDTIRGTTKVIYSNLTDTEFTNTGGLTAFNSDGFSIGNETGINSNNSPIVAWAWDAGSSTVTNTDGSISSQVRANASAGFSIVTYTGTGSALSFGHGLGVQPQFFIIKQRNAANYWAVGHSYDFTKILYLNTTDSAGSSATAWPTAPTSTVINLGTSGYVNAAGDFVAYCFAPVDGYSSFGSYIGDNAATSDSNFVYLGFRPRFLMIKCSSSSSFAHWHMLDSARDTYNVAYNRLAANSSAAENSYGWGPNTANSVVDFLSNGFKIRTSGTDGINRAQTHIYAAFAENPFALNARAR